MKKDCSYIDEAKHQRISILPPNINQSHWYYKASNKGIYLSLGTIKGIGYQSVKLIIDERSRMDLIEISLIFQDVYLKG